jgi:CRP-like cAMP-binding protein
MIIGMVAITDTIVIGVSREAMNTVAQQDNRLARQIGDVIEMRRRSARDALAEVAEGVR